MVLGRDITRRVEVRMQLKATHPTHKPATGTAVVAGDMPTAATGLRGMPGVNPSHRTTPFLGFVRNKRLQLRKRPAMHPATGFGALADLRALADVRQVLQHQRCAGRRRLDNLLAQDMIAITAKAGLLPTRLPQMPPGAFAALALKLALEVEQPPLNRFPCGLAQKAVGARDGGLGDPQVNADNRIRRRYDRGGHRHDHMQPPDTAPVDQVCGIHGIARVVGVVAGHVKADGLPPARGAHPHGLTFPIHAVGMQVVARRAGVGRGHPDLAPLLLECERALDGFGGLDPCLYQQIRHQRRVVGLRGVVGCVMQRDTVGDLLLPPDLTHRVNRRREQAARVGKAVCLCERRG